MAFARCGSRAGTADRPSSDEGRWGRPAGDRPRATPLRMAPSLPPGAMSLVGGTQGFCVLTYCRFHPRVMPRWPGTGRGRGRGGAARRRSASAVTTAPVRSRLASSGANPGTSPGAPLTWRWASTARVAWSIAASKWTCRPSRRAPRSVLPSTATARRRYWPGRSRSSSHAPITAASAVGSTRARLRRIAASAGTTHRSGASRQAPSAARTGCGVSAAHSAIVHRVGPPSRAGSHSPGPLLTRGPSTDKETR
jgi:hypothetical protein